MKLRDFKQIRRDFKELKKSGNCKQEMQEYLKYEKNPLFFYRRIEPDSLIENKEILCSLHNHSDGGNYDLEDLAMIAALRGYKIFAVTNHRRDSQFEGNIILYNEDFDIYLLRGMECRCEEPSNRPKKKKVFFNLRRLRFSSKEVHGEENDLVLVGYKNSIKDFEPIYETAKKARELGSLVIPTPPLNKYLKGASKERLLSIREFIDAIEILDSNCVSSLSCYDILAKKFCEENNIPGIYANDAHTLAEIGCAGIGFKEKDFEFLEDPEYVVNNPEVLVEAIRISLEKRRFTNYGYHVPKLSFTRPAKIISLLRDAVLRPFDVHVGNWLYKKT